MTDADRTVTIVIPASNEARLLPACLGALLASDPPHLGVEVVVVSNASRDGTAEVARGFEAAMAAKGWDLKVLDLERGGKVLALNAGDRVARGAFRVYMDADMTFSPRLLAGLARVVDRSDAAFASGRPAPSRSHRMASRAYTRLWMRVPFMAKGVPGCGLYAVNGPGRARWGEWPDVIADDLFARLQFAPHERYLVPEPYSFPMAEDLSSLVRVRRRQDQGTSELATRFPDLARNDDKARIGPLGLAALCLREPLGFVVYAGVSLAVRARRGDGSWSRAR